MYSFQYRFELGKKVNHKIVRGWRRLMTLGVCLLVNDKLNIRILSTTKQNLNNAMQNLKSLVCWSSTYLLNTKGICDNNSPASLLKQTVPLDVAILNSYTLIYFTTHTIHSSLQFVVWFFYNVIVFWVLDY